MMSDKNRLQQTKVKQAVKRAATAAISAGYTLMHGFVELKDFAPKSMRLSELPSECIVFGFQKHILAKQN
jgi:hypothetical protein